MQTLAHENRETLEIFAAAQGIPKGGMFSSVNPCLVLQKQSDNGQWVTIGRTETQSGVTDTTFRAAITHEYVFQTKQILKAVLMNDGGNNHLTEIGSFQFELPKLIAAPVGKFINDLMSPAGKNVGKITLAIAPVVRDRFAYNIDLKCMGVKDVQMFSKSDPLIRVYRPRPDQEGQRNAALIPDAGWVRVHETEYKKNELNPDFLPFSITASKLNRGDEDAPVKFEIWDYTTGVDNYKNRIGKGYITVRQILEQNIRTIKTFDEKGKPSGDIIIEKFEKIRTYDMLDYVKGGLNIGQVLAIDFTSSNGNPKDPNSLHYFDQNTSNTYELVIQAVANILFQYDKDGKIPMYGFGARFPIIGVNDTKDFFFLQTPGLICATSAAEACKIYESAFEYTELSGPCHLSPAIKSTADWVRGVMTIDKLFYGVLIIITDGEVKDMDQTIQAIIEAAELPMSVILIGVGNANFDDLSRLDGNKEKLRSNANVSPSRDIVTFVPYKTIPNITLLSEAILSELPHQIVNYFRMRNIAPNVQ